MKDLLSRYYKITLSVVFALAIFLFWYGEHRALLNFQEEQQLFLLTSAYLNERLATPGGLADYLGEFVVQFYFVPLIGAAMLGVLFLCLQRASWNVCKLCGATDQWYALSFVPAISLWIYMADENMMLGFGIALVAVQLVMALYAKTSQLQRKNVAKAVFVLVAVPLTYWLFGTVVWTLALFVLCFEIKKKAQWWWGIVALALAFATIYGSSFVVAYPLDRLFLGLDYHRIPTITPLLQHVCMALAALVPVCCSLLPTLKLRYAIAETACLLLVGAVAYTCLQGAYDAKEYEVMDYDRLVRARQWDAIIAKAERKQPSSPSTVASLNLALAMNGQLLDRMFDFYQNGTDGLIPLSKETILVTLARSEIFYHLGMTNDAERMAFEAMEGMGNFHKSARVVKRLAECNIINAHYAVAEKHLRTLTHTLFYKDWANSMLAMLKTPVDVAKHEEYARLRHLHISENNFLFSEQEMDNMLGRLLIDRNKYENRMAYEYLVAHALLKKDMQKFNSYYPLGQNMHLDHIPNAIQQTLVGNWMRSHSSFEGMPYSVSQANVESTVNYIRTYMANANDPALATYPLCTNVWRYLLAGTNGSAQK